MSMSKAFDIEVADPLKLFLMWCFATATPEKNGSRICNLAYIERAYPYSVLRTMTELFEADVIPLMHITHEEEENPKKIKVVLAREKPKQIPSGYDFRTEFPELPAKNAYWTLCYGFFDKGREPEAYVQEYLEKWSNEDLYFKEKNILKPSVQIGRVAKTIFAIADDHSYKHMLVGESNMIPNDAAGLDFVATLLFLEQKGIISIEECVIAHDFKSGKHDDSLFFRITLLDRFFQHFSRTKHGTADFNFEELCNIDKNAKVILFDAPQKLQCDGFSDYPLNRGKLPFTIMNGSFDNRTITGISIEKIIKEANLSEDGFKKGIENFRRELRQRFKFPEDETFFELDNGELRLKPGIFQKKVKKV